ncbi:hypothetical protein ACMSI6_28275 [Pseudomonas antarctica]|uniref:hypothetical protein n=1 Tax=Pseudomonas antarctica TaxID=219572 RepID=UPI0039C10C5A
MNLKAAGCYSDELLAFVITCLFCGVIDRQEFNAWCVQAVSMADAPEYLYDLIEFRDEMFKVYKVIGYVPSWEHSDADEYALYGIAVRRGFEPFDMPISSDQAIANLDASPEVERLFVEVFDFIRL